MYTPSGNNRWFGQSKNHKNRLKELFSSFICHVYHFLLMRTPLNFFECPSILVSKIMYLLSRCASLHLPTRLHGKVYYTLHTTAPCTAIFHRDLRYCRSRIDFCKRVTTCHTQERQSLKMRHYRLTQIKKQTRYRYKDELNKVKDNI